MQSSHWITWKIDEKWKIVKFPLNNMANWWEIEKNAKLPLNIMENCSKGLKYALSGRMEIHPCVLQDISPLGPLPCSHSTSSAITQSRASGTADRVRSLDDFLFFHQFSMFFNENYWSIHFLSIFHVIQWCNGALKPSRAEVPLCSTGHRLLRGRCPANHHLQSQTYWAGQRESLTTYYPWATY